ncbi:MAG: sigma-70 family RNA polymerase sigma factor [Planctomycetes bacterium]|nr:sigma-70 family RNA polymerase sigma factor [Planctomycetota bacterium]
MSDVTRILNAIERGDAGATDELLPLVYEELRLLAAQKLSHEPPGQTLQATALVHEAYLRLVGDEPHPWNSRGHFFAAAAEAMRRILVERARRRRSEKHGGDRHRIPLEAGDIEVALPAEQIVALSDALDALEREDREVAQLVKLRYFVGLTLEQAAELLQISARTAYRHWAYAKARLHEELTDNR